MLLNIQRCLLAALLLATVSAIGCAEAYPPPAQGQESTNAESRTDVDSSNQEQKPMREYEIISKEADGSTTVQFTQVIFTPETRTRLVTYEDGHESEETYDLWMPVTNLKTVTVPAGEDVVGYLNECFPEALPRPEDDEYVIYEIVERKPNGTTIVQVDAYNFQKDIRTRTITRNGRSLEQCYAHYEPTLHEVARISVPAGQDILQMVDDFQMSIIEPPVDNDIPPAPVVDSEVPVAPEA